MFTGRSLGGDQEPSFPKRSGDDAIGGGACGWPHRTFSFDRRMTSAVALFLEREDVSDGASGSDEAEAARPPAGAQQM